MNLSAREQATLSRIFGLLADGLGEHEVRQRVGRSLLDLMHADHFASYIWDAAAGRFGHGLWLNMDDANLRRYEDWYQFRDPITFALQERRHATLVSEVMPHRQLARSEFFNDFLARDGLHWGINLHAFDGAQALGDLRIWRGRQRREFEARDKALLNLIEPAFIAALRRSQATRAMGPAAGPLISTTACPNKTPLSPRERAVAHHVAQGCTDKEIARALGVSVSSVRTYLARLAEKTGAHRRAAVARLVE